MVLTPSDINTFTTDQIQADISNSIYKAYKTAITMDANGIIAASDLKTHVENIMHDRVIMVPKFTVATKENLDEVTEFNNKMKLLFDDLKKEYDYYNDRYRYAIWSLLNALVEGTATATQIEEKKTIAKDLNKKLNVLIQLTQGISIFAYRNAEKNEGEIQDMNESLNDKAATIRTHSELLQKNLSNMELRKQMVEYTQEKARATENLLSLYFVLNVFAIGALLYVYKAN